MVSQFINELGKSSKNKLILLKSKRYHAITQHCGE